MQDVTSVNYYLLLIPKSFTLLAPLNKVKTFGIREQWVGYKGFILFNFV